MPGGSSLVLWSLVASLLGFLGVALLLYEFKFHQVTDTLDGFSTRVLFVVFMASAMAPFYVSALRRVPVLYLVLPVVLLVFLYPIFSPYGLPYSHDPIYNYQFALALLNTDTWQPLLQVTAQAHTYSYYPGGAVFNAEVASLTGLPLLETFNWSYDLLRLLVIPLAVYAFTARVFGGRAAPLAVLLYLSVPSVEMNVPTQQDFATVWFLLVFVVLGFLATSRARESTTFLRVMVIVFSAMAILSHHVTTYLLLGLLAGLAILPWLVQRRDPYPNARSLTVLVRTIAFVLLWVALVTLPVVQRQRDLLFTNFLSIFTSASSAHALAPPGQSFPAYELAWLGIAIVLLVGSALICLIEIFPGGRHAYASFGILTSMLVGVLAIPFFSTGFTFLALRVFEYVGIFLAPAAAWWLTHRLARRRSGNAAAPPSPRPEAGKNAGPLRGRGPAALAVVFAFVMVTGGLLVPLSTRDQFAEAPSDLQVSSPMLVNESAYAAAFWANDHLNHSQPIWGDYLTYSVLGGYAHFETVWNSFPMFATASFNTTLVQRMHVGQYVVVDVPMMTPYSPPLFYGPSDQQPAFPIPAVNLAKFDQPGYFAVLYQNDIFTIYQIAQIPPPGG